MGNSVYNSIIAIINDYKSLGFDLRNAKTLRSKEIFFATLFARKVSASQIQSERASQIQSAIALLTSEGKLSNQFEVKTLGEYTNVERGVINSKFLEKNTLTSNFVFLATPAGFEYRTKKTSEGNKRAIDSPKISEVKKPTLGESAQNLIAFNKILNAIFQSEGTNLLRTYYVSLQRRESLSFRYDLIESLVASIFLRKDVSIKDKGLAAQLCEACKVDNLRINESDESALNLEFKVRFEKRTKTKITSEVKRNNITHNAFKFFALICRNNKNAAAKKTVNQFRPAVIIDLIDFLHQTKKDKSEAIRNLSIFGIKALCKELKYVLFKQVNEALKSNETSHANESESLGTEKDASASFIVEINKPKTKRITKTVTA